jgi:hypothetical protein
MQQADFAGSGLLFRLFPAFWRDHTGGASVASQDAAGAGAFADVRTRTAVDSRIPPAHADWPAFDAGEAAVPGGA